MPKEAPTHLDFSAADRIQLTEACQKLLGTREYDGKKPSRRSHFKPSQEQVGAIDYLYSQIEDQIEQRARGENAPGYEAIQKAIHTQREMLTAIAQRIDWMVQAEASPSKSNPRPTAKEWEEVFLQLHGIVTTD